MNFVHLIERNREILAAVEHTASQIGFDLERRSEEADSPEKTTENHDYYDENHRSANFVKQERHVESANRSVSESYRTVV